VATVEGVFGFPPVELRVRVRRGHGVDSWIAFERVVGLWLRSDPVTGHGRVWQWVVDVDPGLPALTDVLASCHDFLVDDDCGRAVGVVEDVITAPDAAGPALLLVVQGWGRHRMTVPVDDVVEVVPGGRRLVITCRSGHRPPQVEHARAGWGTPGDAVRFVRSLAARRLCRRTLVRENRTDHDADQVDPEVAQLAGLAAGKPAHQGNRDRDADCGRGEVLHR
jgi:hypothetical protein